MSAKKPVDSLETFGAAYGTTSPKEFSKKCYRDIDDEPVPGLFGYISYKNRAANALDLKLQIELGDAEIVWPAKAMHRKKFPIIIEQKQNALFLFRKQGTSEFSCNIPSDFTPRRLERSELEKLIKLEKETNAGFAKAKSFYKFYHKKEHSTIGFYFHNKSTTHDLFIRGELTL